MATVSAGILMYRVRSGGAEFFLVHPGGPYWAKKDDGAWSLPKGEVHPGESEIDAARREFEEETGFPVTGRLHALAPVKQRGGKVIHAWACEGDCDPAALRSNLLSLEWPPNSGRQQEFPEVDRAAWFPPAVALEKIVPGQRPFISELLAMLAAK